MEERQMCNAACCKMESLRLVVAYVVRPYTLLRKVNKKTGVVVKSDGKETGSVASAIPLAVDAVAICSAVVELVGKRKAANDYLYTSLGELKRAWVVGVAPFAYTFASEVDGKGAAVAANIAQPKFFAGCQHPFQAVGRIRSARLGIFQSEQFEKAGLPPQTCEVFATAAHAYRPEIHPVRVYQREVPFAFHLIKQNIAR